MEISMAQDDPPPRQFEDRPALPPPSGDSQNQGMNPDQRRVIIFVIIAIVVLVGVTVYCIWLLANAPVDSVARIRDIFIIFLAVQSLFTGLALVILMIQLARLINLLQNEIKPILDSTNQTVSTLRGTTAFLSDNLVQPVIKMNEYMAGLVQLLQVIGLVKRSSKNRPSKGE